MTGLLHIVLARKPLEGTVAENCLQWGCGALWIDGTRVATKGGDWKGKGGGGVHQHWQGKRIEDDLYDGGFTRTGVDHSSGRFPANLILGGEEVVGLFPNVKQPSFRKARTGNNTSGWGLDDNGEPFGYLDSGSASRFFFNFLEQESDE